LLQQHLARVWKGKAQRRGGRRQRRARRCPFVSFVVRLLSLSLHSSCLSHGRSKKKKAQLLSAKIITPSQECPFVRPPINAREKRQKFQRVNLRKIVFKKTTENCHFSKSSYLVFIYFNFKKESRKKSRDGQLLCIFHIIKESRKNKEEIGNFFLIFTHCKRI
jgi:hypothetical protein